MQKLVYFLAHLKRKCKCNTCQIVCLPHVKHYLLLVWHFASLHFAKKAKMTLLKREERACYLEHHKLAKQKLQKCYLAYLKKQNLHIVKIC